MRWILYFYNVTQNSFEIIVTLNDTVSLDKLSLMPCNITLLLLFPGMNKVSGQLVLVTSNRRHALVPLLSCSVNVLELKEELIL